MKILVVGDFQGKFPEKLKKKLKKEEFDLVIGVGDYSGLDDFRPWIMKRMKLAKEGKEAPSIEEMMGKKKFNELLKKDFERGKNVLKEINSLGKGKEVIFVFGNSDEGWYKSHFDKKEVLEKKKANFIKKMKKMKNITYGKTSLNGFDFIGFGGYMDIDVYFNKNKFKDAKDGEILESRIDRRAKSRKNLFNRLKISRNKNKVFVFHYPPKSVFDIIRGGKGNPMNGKSAGIKFFREAIIKYKPKLVLCGHMHEYQGMKKLYGVPIINPGDAGEGKYAIVELINNKINSVRFEK